MWVIDYDLIEGWLDEQDDETVAHIFAAFEVLSEEGPSLGRPLVDSIKGSKIKNMKELRPASSGSSEVRMLFAFDPLRRAIMLFAGDKSKGGRGRDRWAGWYRKAIPEAERRWVEYLRGLGEQHV